jgi:transcriptional regulator of acetoin/glycerol metabolism
MAHLYHQLAGSGHSIILTDHEGVLLGYYGDLSFKNAASRTGLVLGAVWSEQYGGTNGMGTCLFERAPLIIHRNQHFLARNTGLTCCAAPIFDHRGELVAVLDASGESDRAQQHTLVLVNMSAQMIENRMFQHRFRDTFVVRFHSRPELVGTWGEGIIALDSNGTIAALDRNALFQLGCKTAEEVLHAPLERVFNISLPTLLGRSHKKSFRALPIYETRHGGRFFAVAQAPQTKRRASPQHAVIPDDALPVSSVRSVLDELDLGDAVMARNIRAAKRLESRDVPIVLIGETGTGKELFARALHSASDRADKPFVALNCSSLPEPLLRNELFGHPPGDAAARDDHRGKIVLAHTGTLFLDNIGDLPLGLQAQLLHVLEEREVLVQGCDVPTKVDVHLICATQINLQEIVRRGEFREDLFYRLQGLVLTMPRLCDRKDKAALVRQVFAQEAAATPSVWMTEELAEALCAYQWPGNIRQLRNVLRAMIVLRTGDRLDLQDLPADYGIGTPVPTPEPAPSDESALNALEKAQREALLRELDLAHGNISHVAHTLGVGRNTLYRKMRRLGIKLSHRKSVHLPRKPES